MTTELTPDERARLQALRGYGILDTAPDAVFDAIVREASRHYDTPIALVTFVDELRQWFKAGVGLDISETTRDVSFCSHAITSDEPMVVPDATRDPRFRDNPLVMGEPGIRFYAGAPVVTQSGERLGTVCIIDTVPRDLPEDDLGYLQELAALVRGVLEKRRHHPSPPESPVEGSSFIGASVVVDRAGRVVEISGTARQLLGASGDAVGRPVDQVFELRPPAEDGGALRAALEAGRVWRGLATFVLPGGQVRHLELMVGPARGDDGRTVYLFNPA